MSKLNSLLRKQGNKDLNTSTDTTEKTMTANDVELDASFGDSTPLSPSTGKPMVFAYARNVPIWFCPDSRLVLPCRKS